MKPAIVTKSVSKKFGQLGSDTELVALQETSLEVRQGELMCFIGPSGCGKSTLLNIVAGLMTPTTGTVAVGDDVIQGHPVPSKISMVFQENTLFPWNTILDNVILGLKFQGVPASERQDRASDALKTVGLGSFLNHYPGQLSGGMKQRAALARAISMDTPIILMDEPFGALDEQTRIVLGEDLSQLLDNTGKTIVFVTHSLGEAVFLADRVAVFSARPGTIKTIIDIDEPHPRSADFMTSSRFNDLRNQLFEHLHEEIRKTMKEQSLR